MFKGPFEACHEVVDPQPYFADCVYDLCATLPDDSLLCPDIRSYADECRSNLVEIGLWRTRQFCRKYRVSKEDKVWSWHSDCSYEVDVFFTRLCCTRQKCHREMDQNDTGYFWSKEDRVDTLIVTMKIIGFSQGYAELCKALIHWNQCHRLLCLHDMVSEIETWHKGGYLNKCVIPQVSNPIWQFVFEHSFAGKHYPTA